MCEHWHCKMVNSWFIYALQCLSGYWRPCSAAMVILQYMMYLTYIHITLRTSSRYCCHCASLNVEPLPTIAENSVLIAQLRTYIHTNTHYTKAMNRSTTNVRRGSSIINHSVLSGQCKRERFWQLNRLNTATATADSTWAWYLVKQLSSVTPKAVTVCVRHLWSMISSKPSQLSKHCTPHLNSVCIKWPV
jgi:hypothetical protein